MLHSMGNWIQEVFENGNTTGPKSKTCYFCISLFCSLPYYADSIVYQRTFASFQEAGCAFCFFEILLWKARRGIIVALDESAAVEKLQKLFPTGVIFADQYMKQTGLLSFEVHKIAKACGKTRAEWLSSHGFVWKETGYVEPDMRIRDVEAPVDGTDAFRIADYVFRRFPLAGEDILTQEENQLLYQSANQTVKKILMGDTHITKRDEVVLVLETIELLKSWSTDLLNREGAGTFWNYIFMQYGFHPENSEEAEKRLYARFRLAIRNTLDTYKRFFAPAGTHRYYTSLLLHALAPRQSIEALFNILFDFYVKNLDFQYVVEDISYKVFTKGMRARWDTHITKDDHLQDSI